MMKGGIGSLECFRLGWCYDWEDDEEITTITDKSFITELTSELETVSTSSTAALDIPNCLVSRILLKSAASFLC
ncbi:hypothetical protein HUG20_04510 [Salicibibacter cibi]|uniref:Uncharacterized protein n=1 Tax=Salicibibacter cibi TaxID=2743001 RepID=A0A7T6Z9A4_9BACI|nr:hypothetical protein [Salicibibacter cibi]QQK79222.1 hypothetical protein HUG20_04510 [Salicibibacter cibi]